MQSKIQGEIGLLLWLIVFLCRHHENLPECNGMTSVNVSLSSNNDPRNASAIVGVIYYKDLEDAFNRTHELDDNK